MKSHGQQDNSLTVALLSVVASRHMSPRKLNMLKAYLYVGLGKNSLIPLYRATAEKRTANRATSMLLFSC